MMMQPVERKPPSTLKPPECKAAASIKCVHLFKSIFHVTSCSESNNTHFCKDFISLGGGFIIIFLLFALYYVLRQIEADFRRELQKMSRNFGSGHFSCVCLSHLKMTAGDFHIFWNI